MNQMIEHDFLWLYHGSKNKTDQSGKLLSSLKQQSATINILTFQKGKTLNPLKGTFIPLVQPIRRC